MLTLCYAWFKNRNRGSFLSDYFCIMEYTSIIEQQAIIQAVPYGYGQAPFAGYAGPEMAMASPLDAEIQVVLREIHTELQTLESSGEYGKQIRL